MNYSLDIKRCIEYIELHIKEDLSAEQIAGEMGYSLFHFCRVFCLCMDKPLMEYVRSRRLSLARVELLTDKRIIDLAIEYGFETASGFSKAFRKEFGYSPTQYIARRKNGNDSMIDIGGIRMNPVMMKKNAFLVAGYGMKTNITSGYTRDVAAYWEVYEGENLECKLYKQLNPPKHGEVCMCIPTDESGNMTYLLGVIVEDLAKVTPDMITVSVPEAEYAVFTTMPVDTSDNSCDKQDAFPNAIKALWKYIFEEWFPSSDYEYDESKLDFEFYDERCHFRTDTVMDIYVPVLKREKD